MTSSTIKIYILQNYRLQCFEVDAICTGGDNAHFSLLINQNVALRMVQIIKGITERKIFKKYYAI